MKNNDLRIGNHVFCKETGQVQKVTGVTEENVFIDAVTWDYLSIEDFEPIPLTEEWLDKFGYNKWPNDGYAISSCVMWLDNGRIIVHFGMTTIIVIKCEFVHEFQNILFMLEGKELTIKQAEK